MSQTVSQELADNRSRLLQKLDLNADLCGVLIALLGKLVIDFQHSPCIRMAPIVDFGNGEFRSRIEVIFNPLITPPQLVGRNDLKDYMAAKNIALSVVLSKNKSIADFFQQLVERVERYAEHKRIPFKDLKVIQGGAFISRDREFVLRVGKESIVDKTPFRNDR